ncbi:hypothetical protein G3I40_28760 [Streptomyces sp. SID14478]|uniref:hypothetical protein n=1 Tax=Streptomyces sp. SID14478 TaxID=2706073 RepID=UPI0013D98C44|nr:hypothetical protein [Streptomyces sp. SID14478]NEB79179.1 hypothetical protein [Streptomyces sp. SID14478]
MTGTDDNRDDSRDVFEGGLGLALRRAGEGFSAEGRALVDGGVLRGRRRLRRRRTGAVIGSVAALAVVGLGTSYVAGAFDAGGATGRGGVAARTSAAPTKAPGKAPGKQGGHGSAPQLSKDKVIAVLEGLLPEGKVSGREGRGTADRLGPLAHLVYDDGRGKGAIGVSVGAVDPDGAAVEEQLQCPDKRLVPYDACTSETLGDGSKLLLMRGYEYPDRRVDTKMWHAYLVTPEGYTVDAGEWNAAAEKDAPVSRDQPPLSMAQLKALVTSSKWRPVMEAVGTAAPEALAQPPALGTDKAAILKKLKGLLPQRAKVTAEGGQDAGYAYVVVDDGKGATLVQINVQSGMNDVRGDLFGSDAELLPDGTQVATRKGDGDDKGGAGIVMWTADTMRKDGFRVAVSAFNSGSQTTDATRAEPALTMAELKKIALSPQWTQG